MFKTLLLAAVALAPLAATAAELPEALRNRGKIVTAIVPNYPPLEFRDPATGKLTGFDVELGEMIAARRGVEIVWQETSFDQMIASLRTGRVDMILSGMADNPTRRGVANFVLYLRTGAQFFTQASRAAEFPTIASLCGKKVGASRRTSYPATIKAYSDAECVAKGLPAMDVIGTEGSADARNQLRQGRIDAAVQGGETLPYLMTQSPDTFSLIGTPISYNQLGMAVPRDQPEFAQAIAETLRELIADGSYAKLLEKWSLQDSAITEVSITGLQ